ncbi:hypothetical protein AVEN_127979-1 [Araneus ventricosus]|uniref:Uncharacterized protein n=1 Tax=Araneus ventricosus TaxID=182803 RepID=A0A4Y2A009_ARAVE|nr:hypothetical protein AVEN_127979-1 [Araneus ventricosus]
MTRTTPELAPLSKHPHHTSGRTFDSLRMIQRAKGPIHDESSVESGFEPGTLRLRVRYLITRPSRPHMADLSHGFSQDSPCTIKSSNAEMPYTEMVKEPAESDEGMSFDCGSQTASTFSEVNDAAFK